jgi:hypothetical protein
MNRDANGDSWSYQPYDDSGDNQQRDKQRTFNNFKKGPYKSGPRQQGVNERTMISDYIDPKKSNKYSNNNVRRWVLY